MSIFCVKFNLNSQLLTQIKTRAICPPQLLFRLVRNLEIFQYRQKQEVRRSVSHSFESNAGLLV